MIYALSVYFIFSSLYWYAAAVAYAGEYVIMEMKSRVTKSWRDATQDEMLNR